MLWLIQRDFLQGASVQAMVTQALQPVANPNSDADIDQARSWSNPTPQTLAPKACMPRGSTAAHAEASSLGMPEHVHTGVTRVSCRWFSPSWTRPRAQPRRRPLSCRQAVQKLLAGSGCGAQPCCRAQVNRIRASLNVVARNSTAFGLRQPHLERTRLCQLPDAELDPGYIEQRGALREMVSQLAKPKVGTHIQQAQA